jgi:hypothetical protein
MTTTKDYREIWHYNQITEKYEHLVQNDIDGERIFFTDGKEVHRCLLDGKVLLKGTLL